MLFLDRIDISKPVLGELSTYTIVINEVGLDFTTPQSTKDITVRFPHDEFFFDNTHGCTVRAYRNITNATTNVTSEVRVHITHNLCTGTNNRIHLEFGDAQEDIPLYATDRLELTFD